LENEREKRGLKSLAYQKDYWVSFADMQQKDKLSRDLHGSWDKESQSYSEVTTIPEEFLEVISSDTKKNLALDFGVGMGRNYDYLDSNFSEVWGFDTPQMIRRLKEHKKNVNVSSNLDSIFSRNYDLVYESVSMQHMPPQEVILYLNEISRKAKYFFSWTRCYNDYLRNFESMTGGVNMLRLVSSLNVFDLLECSISPREAASKMDETHYSALYKCRNYKEQRVVSTINSDGTVQY
jgi:hypothetical protein